MSRGLSKIQKHIKGLLDGEIKGQVYSNAAGGLGTREILEELEDAGLIKTENYKTAMFTTWRACNSMFNRGLIDAKYAKTDSNDKQVEWYGKGGK